MKKNRWTDKSSKSRKLTCLLSYKEAFLCEEILIVAFDNKDRYNSP